VSTAIIKMIIHMINPKTRITPRVRGHPRREIEYT
jgi:hypothetical protein